MEEQTERYPITYQVKNNIYRVDLYRIARKAVKEFRRQLPKAPKNYRPSNQLVTDLVCALAEEFRKRIDERPQESRRLP